MGTDWKIIGQQLRLDKYRILSLMVIALVGASVVLWGNNRIYMALGGAMAMVPAAYLDGRYGKLYHRLTISMVIWGGLLTLGLAIFLPAYHWQQALEGMVCLGGMFFLLYFVTGQIGFGDVCYGAALGIFLGWQGAMLTFILTFALGLAAALREYLYYFVHGKWRRRILPLGPFMACGAYITLLWGQELIGWYIRMF